MGRAVAQRGPRLPRRGARRRPAPAPGTQRPDSIRERSRRSSTRCCIRRELFRIVVRNWRSSASSGRSVRIVSAYPEIEVSGVLSSWETLATKSRRTASSRRISVTSCRTSRAPAGGERAGVHDRACSRPARSRDSGPLFRRARSPRPPAPPSPGTAPVDREAPRARRSPSSRRAAPFAVVMRPRPSAAITPSVIASTSAADSARSRRSSSNRSASCRCICRSACTSASMSGMPDRGNRGREPAAIARDAATRPLNGWVMDRPATRPTGSPPPARRAHRPRWPPGIGARSRLTGDRLEISRIDARTCPARTRTSGRHRAPPRLATGCGRSGEHGTDVGLRGQRSEARERPGRELAVVPGTTGAVEEHDPHPVLPGETLNRCGPRRAVGRHGLTNENRLAEQRPGDVGLEIPAQRAVGVARRARGS